MVRDRHALVEAAVKWGSDTQQVVAQSNYNMTVATAVKEDGVSRTVYRDVGGGGAELVGKASCA